MGVKKIETKTFVRNKFAEYYQECSSNILSPPFIEKREFGFILFSERMMMLRHKNFKNIDTLRSFLKSTISSDVLYSSAYYEEPAAEMEEKGWLGADLIFDIDADHIPTSCPKTHNIWICNNCGATGKGITPTQCSSCKKQNFKEKTWFCELCLTSAKEETIKLIDFLMKDFGISTKEIKVAFSGHRGYHLHVNNEEIRRLDSLSRKEIVDYIRGIGLELSFHGLEKRRDRISPILSGSDSQDLGWRDRIAQGTYNFILTSSREKLEKIGLKKKITNLWINHREDLLRSWEKNKSLRHIQGLGIEKEREIIQQGVENQSAKIDTVVTTDVHRLIRLSNTLHGKTGFKKTDVSITDIDRFDPFKSAIVFKKGRVIIFVSDAPQFRLGDDIYGPYNNEEVELPTSAALLLLCKELARVKGET